MNDQIGLSSCVLGRSKTDTQSGGDACFVGIDVDQFDTTARNLCDQPRNETPERTGTDDGNAVTNFRDRIPQTVDRTFEVGREHRALGRHIGGHRIHGFGRHNVTSLMGIETEHDTAPQSGRSLFHVPDIDISILDRRRKVAGLKRRSHPSELACRHRTVEDKGFSATTDAAVQRPDQNFLGGRFGQSLGTNFARARSDDPERARIIAGIGHHVFLLVAADTCCMKQ